MTLNNLADSEAALGRLDLSLNYLREQESIRLALGDELGLNQMRVSLADTYLSLGDGERALEALVSTLPHWPALKDPETEAAAYAKLGQAYMALGEYDAARTELEKAIRLGEQLKNSRIAAGNTLLLAQLANLDGHSAGAAAQYRRALALSREAQFRGGQMEALLGLGQLDDALAIARELAQPYHEARIRREMGAAAAAAGDLDGARRQLETALAMERSLGDRFGEVRTLDALAALDDRQGRVQEAVARLTEAIDAIDATRSSLAEPALRADYLASQRSVYEHAANLLARQTDGQERAFAVSERAHARALLDVVGEAREVRESAADPALAARARALDAALHARAASLETQPSNGDARIAELLAERTAAELRLHSGAGSETLPLAALRRRLMEDRNVALPEYLSGREESHLWVVAESGLCHYLLPAGESPGAVSARVLPGVNGPQPARREYGRGGRGCVPKFGRAGPRAAAGSGGGVGWANPGGGPGWPAATGALYPAVGPMPCVGNGAFGLRRRNVARRGRATGAAEAAGDRRPGE